jgi:hypothetical protein
MLPTEEVIRRICDTSYEPGHRPNLLKPTKVRVRGALVSRSRPSSYHDWTVV